MLALHEPFWNLLGFGETDVDGRTFEAAASLLACLRDETHDVNVFLKDTTDHRYGEVLVDRRFLAEARHAFLIRRPEEIAASTTRCWPDMRIDEVGLEALHELTRRPMLAGTRRSSSTPTPSWPDPRRQVAYCAAGAAVDPAGAHVGAGRAARVAAVRPLALDVSRQLRVRAAQRTYASTVKSSDELARFAAHHRPCYEHPRTAARRRRVGAMGPFDP